jgi:hypothetical protein
VAASVLESVDGRGGGSGHRYNVKNDTTRIELRRTAYVIRT